MKQITLKAVITDEQANEYLKKPAEVSHAPVIVDEEFIAVDEQGVVQLVYIKLPENDDYNKLKAVLQKLKYTTGTRLSGLSTSSSPFGFKPRVHIRQAMPCTASPLRGEYPKIDAFMAYYCEKNIIPLFHEHYSENLKQHMEAIKDIKKDWLINNVPFTGGIINNSNQLNYHTDIQNIKGSINAMIYLERDTDGGELVLPKYGVSLKPKDRFVLLFRNDLVHGVAPIKKLNNQSYRYSIVYYANAGMELCGTKEEELSLIRNKQVRE